MIKQQQKVKRNSKQDSCKKKQVEWSYCNYSYRGGEVVFGH
jgi:hypothetical protein